MGKKMKQYNWFSGCLTGFATIFPFFFSRMPGGKEKTIEE